MTVLQPEAILARAVSQLYHAGLITPTGGNVSCRWEENILITPSKKNKGDLSCDDMLWLDGKGRVLRGDGLPSIETSMHLAIYRRYPGVQALVHDHAAAGILLGALELPIQVLCLEACSFHDVPRLPFLPPGSPQLAEGTAEMLDGQGSILLLNHGALTAAGSLQEAVNRCFMLERAARLSLWSAMLSGSPRIIPAELWDSLSL